MKVWGAKHNGFGLMEGLVTIALTAVLLTMVASQFFDVSKQSFDQRIKMEADEEARILLDILAYDIRMTGAGMPLSQSNFAAGGAGLGDAPLPILLSSTADYIAIRLNDRGSTTYLTADYTPDLTSLTFDVVSSEDFAVGDTIYISNMYTGGHDALKGKIAWISGNQLTIDNGFITNAGSVFSSGSRVQRISEIHLDSSGPSVSRSVDGGTAVTLQPRSSFEVQYQYADGTPITLPLSTSEISQDLKRMKITVSVSGAHNLRGGGTYTAAASEIVALRNMVE